MLDVKLGVCDWALPGAGLFAPKIAAMAGLQCLSLRAGVWENDYPITHGEMQALYLEEQSKNGVEYVALALNDFDNISMHAPEGSPDYDKVWTLLRRAASTAKALGIPMIQVPAFVRSRIDNEEQMERTAAAFRYLCDAAGELGIDVASENMLTIPQYRVLCQMVDRKNFHLYYDSQNYQLNLGLDQVQVLEEGYEYLCDQLHVKDGNNALSGALLGRGNTNFQGTMEVLKRRNFSGIIILENYYDQLPLRLESENPFALLREDVRILKGAIQ